MHVLRYPWPAARVFYSRRVRHWNVPGVVTVVPRRNHRRYACQALLFHAFPDHVYRYCRLVLLFRVLFHDLEPDFDPHVRLWDDSPCYDDDSCVFRGPCRLRSVPLERLLLPLRVKVHA